MSASLQSLGFLPVSTATLSVATVLNFNLYVQRAGRGFAELYRESKFPLTDQDLEKLREGGIDHLYIRLDDTEQFRQYLHDHVLYEPGIPTPVRFRALRDLTRVAFEDAIRFGSCDALVSVAGGFG